jgi:hypothetical protein
MNEEMRMNNVKTIGSISISRSSKDSVYLRIEDDHSGDRILEMELTLENYDLLLTGLGGIEGEMVVNTDAHVAMEREVKRVVVPEIKKYQDKALTGYEYIIKRYVPVKQIEEGNK